MPFLRAKLTINQGLLGRLRQIPDRARSNMFNLVQSEIAPQMELDLNEAMAAGPGPVSSPFAFATPRSQRYWFVLVSTGQVETDGEHYIRSSDIETSFKVEATGDASGSLFKVFNKHPKSRFVVSPWAVAGHQNTGWSKLTYTAIGIARDKARGRLRSLWPRAVWAAFRGQSL